MTTGRRKYTVGFIGIGKRLGSKTLLKSWADAEAKLGGAADHTEISRMLDE